MKKAELQLEQLTCPTCAKKIQAVLQKTDGVAGATVIYASNKAKVEYDESQATVDQLKQVIGSLGYEVLNVKES